MRLLPMLLVASLLVAPREASARRNAKRVTGLVLGSAGAGIAVMSLSWLMVQSMCVDNCDGPYHHDPNPTPYYAVAGGAAVVSIVGWYLFATAEGPKFPDRKPVEPWSLRDGTFVGFVPTPGGAKLGLTTSF